MVGTLGSSTELTVVISIAQGGTRTQKSGVSAPEYQKPASTSWCNTRLTTELLPCDLLATLMDFVRCVSSRRRRVVSTVPSGSSSQHEGVVPPRSGPCCPPAPC